MKTARQLLEDKAIDGVISVSPTATVYQALQLLADKNIGAVLVIDDDASPVSFPSVITRARSC